MYTFTGPVKSCIWGLFDDLLLFCLHSKQGMVGYSEGTFAIQHRGKRSSLEEKKRVWWRLFSSVTVQGRQCSLLDLLEWPFLMQAVARHSTLWFMTIRNRGQAKLWPMMPKDIGNWPIAIHPSIHPKPCFPRNSSYVLLLLLLLLFSSSSPRYFFCASKEGPFYPNPYAICGRHRFQSRVFCDIFISFHEASILMFLTKNHGTFSSVYVLHVWCTMTWPTMQPSKKEKGIGTKGKKGNLSQLRPTCCVVWYDVCPAISPCRWHSHPGREEKRKEKSVLFPSIHAFILSLASP